MEQRSLENPSVVVTMPAYQAGQTLEPTVRAVPEELVGSLIVVDDASTDDTVSVAEGMGLQVVVHPENRGYGGNQKTCYQTALSAGADVVVLLHPDHQYDPRMVPLLIAPILSGDADMTFGSRFAGLSDPLAGGMPLYRFIGNRTTTIAQNLALGARFSEMHSGMRAYTRDCLLTLPFLNYSDDFDFDSRFLVDAVARGIRVVEVPIPTRYTIESSSISISRSLRYVSRSLMHAAASGLRNGRRGRRSPVTGPRTRGRKLGDGHLVLKNCDLCGHERHSLVYPANVDVPPSSTEFACTAEVTGEHDDIVQCRSCSLVSSQSPLDPDEILAGYQGSIDEHYLDEEEARRHLFRWVLDRASGYALPGRRLLEIGSNQGLFLDEARDYGFDVQGVEPSRDAAQKARDRFGLPVETKALEDLELPEASADAIFLLDVLEHLTSPREALQRFRHTLHPEGVLVLATTNVDSLHSRLRGSEWPWFLRAHLFHFSPPTLRMYLQSTGFRMVEFETVPRSFHLSYIAERSAPQLGKLADGFRRVGEVFDPKLPVGWLGDVVLAVGRPV